MGAIGFGPAISLRHMQRDASFDFSRGTLPPGARLTRASAATRYDASGTMTSVAADVARFDHDPATGASRGLLIEPAAANAFSWSSDWTNAYWTKTNISTTAPDAMIETISAAGHTVRQTTGDLFYVAGQTVTLSAIAAERNGSAKRYLIFSVGTTPVFAATTLAIFDLASGTVTASSNVAAASASPAGGGAWLCWVTVTPATTTGSGQAIVLRLNTSATASVAYTGDGTSGLTISQIQAEIGSVASSRIVTAAAAGTRAGDALVLDWRTLGVPDGAITVRYVFDDGSSQDVATTVSGGSAAVPLTLARRRIMGARKL